MQVIDDKNGQVLWSDKVQATMTKKIMPKDESYTLVYDRFVKSLIIEMFKKKKMQL